jgi:hypothetical protein
MPVVCDTELLSPHLGYLHTNPSSFNGYETIPRLSTLRIDETCICQNFAVAVSLVLSTTYLLFGLKAKLNQPNQTNAIPNPHIIPLHEQTPIKQVLHLASTLTYSAASSASSSDK